MTNKILVFASGTGSTFFHLIHLCNKYRDNFPFEVIGLVSDKSDSNVVQEARKKLLYLPIIIQEKLPKEKRLEYDQRLIESINNNILLNGNFDLIFLAGWMRIVSPTFLDYFQKGKIDVINLHPALPGEYPGINSVSEAFDDCQSGKITQTGSMIHYVDPGIDTGETIETKLLTYDPESHSTINDFTQALKDNEKVLLIRGLFRWAFNHYNPDKRSNTTYQFYRAGKVRNLYHSYQHPLTRNALPQHLVLEHSDRVSSFDRQITVINGRGTLLNIISSKIMTLLEKEKIVKTHYIKHNGLYQEVEICHPIPLEIVVRQYITGNTTTSLWTHYQKDPTKPYCGIQFPPNLAKNQKLEQIVITPTTKGESDYSIAPEDIIKEHILEKEEWDDIKEKALKIFKFGQEIATRLDLILVDTKFEFGYNQKGEIVLIDEALTPDSSRYWIASTYPIRFQMGMEPEKLDKDLIRDFVRERVDDPYQDPIPEIPFSYLERVYNTYRDFARNLFYLDEDLSSLAEDDLNILALSYNNVIKNQDEKNDSYYREIIHSHVANQILTAF